MDERTPALQDAFDSALREKPQSAEPPRVWRVGQHLYLRVDGGVQPYPTENYDESNLSIALAEFRERGVRVLNYERVAYFRDDERVIDWVFKTMAPREVEAT